jgi:valyl-tRNA synthetase
MIVQCRTFYTAFKFKCILLLFILFTSKLQALMLRFQSISRLRSLSQVKFRISQQHRMTLLSKPTPPNFTKDLSAKHFDFKNMEGNIYQWWEKEGYFKPQTNSSPAATGTEETTKKPFVIPMPPPNVTGYLHMGHAIFVALQDILARFHRMRGRPTLWLPGT